MPIYSGIDEAGLGPILGPFCASLTVFKAPAPLKELLKDQQKKLFYVDDSKKVFQGKKGFERLEENVLTFFHLFSGTIPTSVNSFIPSLKSPWNKDLKNLPIKVSKSKIEDNSYKLKKLFNDRGISILDIKRTAVSATDFNHLIDLYNNKSIVCQKIIEPLLLQAAKHSNSNLIIDKQGGRKFYAPYLNELFTSQNISIISEEDNCSSYTVNDLNLSYMAKADSNSFPVALASMYAKYMRELAMNSFNSFWNGQVNNIKPTAGYYTDGIRFLNDLESYKLLPENIDLIRRKK